MMSLLVLSLSIIQRTYKIIVLFISHVLTLFKRSVLTLLYDGYIIKSQILKYIYRILGSMKVRWKSMKIEYLQNDIYSISWRYFMMVILLESSPEVYLQNSWFDESSMKVRWKSNTLNMIYIVFPDAIFWRLYYTESKLKYFYKIHRWNSINIEYPQNNI